MNVPGLNFEPVRFSYDTQDELTLKGRVEVLNKLQLRYPARNISRNEIKFEKLESNVTISPRPFVKPEGFLIHFSYKDLRIFLYTVDGNSFHCDQLDISEYSDDALAFAVKRLTDVTKKKVTLEDIEILYYGKPKKNSSDPGDPNNQFKIRYEDKMYTIHGVSI